jgi:GPH family glycoside/pentoside/hexuronide:cation symporter
VITFATTRERVVPELAQESTLRNDLRFLATNIKMHQLILVGLALLIALSTGMNASVLTWLVPIYLVLSILSFILARFNRVAAAAEIGHSTLELDINDLLGNRPWMVLFCFGLFQLMAAFVRGGATLYYFKYFVGNDVHVPSFFVAGSVAAIAGMLLTKQLTAYFGKKRLMIYMNIGTAVFTGLFFFIGPEQIALMYVLYVVGAFISGPSPVLLWAMYADVADYSEWKNRRRATGLVFSAATFSQKMGVALGAALTGWILDWIGYQPPQAGVEVSQTLLTLNGLKLMMSLLPAGLLVAAAVSLCFYGIDQSMMVLIEKELGERKGSLENGVDAQ